MLDQHPVEVQVSEVVWSLQGVAVAHNLEGVAERMTVVVVGFGIDTRVVDCVPGSLVVHTIVGFVQVEKAVVAVLPEPGLPVQALHGKAKRQG